MALKINNLHITTARTQPKTVQRIFNISPALYGRTTWNLDTQGPINISSSGQWTFAPTSTFHANLKLWGAGGSGNKYNAIQSTGGCGGYSGGTASFQNGSSYVILCGEGGSLAAANAGPSTRGGGYGRHPGTTNTRGGGLSGVRNIVHPSELGHHRRRWRCSLARK